MSRHILEPAAQQFADATSKPPFLYELGAEGARRSWTTSRRTNRQARRRREVDHGSRRVRDVRVRIVKPAAPRVHSRPSSTSTAEAGSSATPVPTIGSSASSPSGEGRGRVRRIRPLPRSAVPGRDRAGVRHRAVDRRARRDRGPRLLPPRDRRRSVGGNMTAAVALLAKQRGDVRFVHQSLYYPVTDAAQDTDSYREFADGPFLRAKGMAWFWDAYCPT